MFVQYSTRKQQVAMLRFLSVGVQPDDEPLAFEKKICDFCTALTLPDGCAR